jgi:hypothetical protein
VELRRLNSADHLEQWRIALASRLWASDRAHLTPVAHGEPRVHAGGQCG